MSEVGGGPVAGRLSVLVEATLARFRQELTAKVEEAAAGVKAQIEVGVNAAGLREELQGRVDEAAAGVRATIGIDVDAAGVREKVIAAAEAARTSVTINVTTDTGSVVAETVAAKEAANAAAGSIDVPVRADTRRFLPDLLGSLSQAAARARSRGASWLSGVFGSRETVAGEATTIGRDAGRAAVAAVADAADTAAGGRSGGRLRGWLSRLFGRSGDVIADAEKLGADAGGAAGRAAARAAADGAAQLPRMRTLFRGSIIFSLLSLVQPLVGGIGQVVAGLTAMTSAAAPAVGTLAAIPIGVAGLIQTMAAGKIATQGFGSALRLLSREQARLARGEKLTKAEQDKLNQALSELSPSAQEAAREVVGLRGAWVAMRKQVQEALFSRLVGEIKPLAATFLPFLSSQLSVTAGRLGDAAAATSRFLRTGKAQSDLGKVMSNNNLILGDFLHMLGQFGKGSLDFLVGSRKFGRAFGGMMRDLGDWFAGKMERGRRTGSLERFLDRAADKASQLWNITRQIGGGLAGLFRAAVPSGERLLGTFEQFVTNWHSWVDSTQGQTYLRDWFTSTEGGFVEVARIVNSTFKAIAKWAADPKIEGLLRMIRTELGPGLNELFTSLSDASAEGVVSVLSGIARSIGNLAPAFEVVGQLTKALGELLDVLNDLADSEPELTSAIAKLAGAFLAFRIAGKYMKVGRGLLGLGAGAAATAGGAGAGVGAAEAGLGGAAGGGLLARLLGRRAASKAATTAGSAAVRDLERSVFRTLRTTKLGKVGLAAIVFNGIDFATDLNSDRSSRRQVAEAIARSIAGGASDAAREKVVRDSWAKLFPEGQEQGTFGKIFSPMSDPAGVKDRAKWISQFDIDIDRLQRAIARAGTASRYYQQSMDKLLDPHSGHLTQGAGLAKVIREIATEVDTAVAQAAADRKSRNDLFHLLFPDAGPTQYDRWVKRQVSAARRAVQNATKQITTILTSPPKYGPEVPKPSPFIKDLRSTITGGLKQPAAPAAPAPNPFTTNYLNTVPQQLGGKKLAGARNQAREAGRVAGAGIAAAARAGFSAGVKSGGRGQKGAAAGGGMFNSLLSQIRRGLAPAASEARTSGKAIGDGLKGATRGARSADRALAGVSTSARNAGRSARSASKDLSSVGRDGGKGFQRLRDIVRTAMSGLVSTIRGTRGQAGSASRTVASSTAAPVRRLRGQMASAGAYAMAGLAAGIRANGNQAVAEARAVAGRVEAATRSRLEIRSPSRVMKRLGAWVSAGFAAGIKGSARQVDQAVRRLWSKLDDAKIAKSRLAKLKARWADEIKAIKANAAARMKVARQLRYAERQLETLRSKRDNLKQTFANTASEAGSLGAAAQENGGYLTASSFIAQLRQKVKDMKSYAWLLAKLRRNGLGERAYNQLAELGFEEGLPIARELAKASKWSLAKINKLQKQLVRYGSKLGKDSSKTYYDQGIETAEGLVKTLRRRQAVLNKLAERMARAFVNQIRRALGIKTKGSGHSSAFNNPTGKKPPKRGHGGHGGHGHGGGKKHHGSSHGGHGSHGHRGGKKHRPQHHARTLAHAASTPPWKRPSIARAFTTAAKPATKRSHTPTAAPLVGQVSITGGAKESAEDLLDAFIWEIRKLNRGGTYAYGTAAE